MPNPRRKPITVKKDTGRRKSTTDTQGNVVVTKTRQNNLMGPKGSSKVITKFNNPLVSGKRRSVQTFAAPKITDAELGFKYGGKTPARSRLRKKGNGDEVTPATTERTAAPAPNYSAMSAKEYRQAKKGAKREAKINRIKDGSQAQRTDAIINTIGNGLGAVNNAMQTVNNVRGGTGSNSAPSGMKRGGSIKKKMVNGGPTPIQAMRRNILTNRSNQLDAKGNENLTAGNKEKANKQFQKSDDLLAKRRAIREKAGYKKGGSVKPKMKTGGVTNRNAKVTVKQYKAPKFPTLRRK